MNEYNILKKEDTVLIKAILILGIILHHIYIRYNSLFFLKPFEYLGWLFVGVFFFLSGFGLYTSMKSKKDYLKRMPSKIIKLIIPFLIALVIYIIVYNFMDKEVNNIFNVVKYSWYIYELLIFYFLFYVCFSLFKEEKAIIIILISILILLTLMYILGFTEYWYKSSFTFAIGIVMARKTKEPKKNINNKLMFFLELLILCTLLIICKMTNLGILDIVLYNFSSILFVVVFLKFYYYIKLYKINTNQILKMIGSASLEIYIYHGLILEIIANYISNGYVGLGLILSISIFISLIINKVDNSINKLVDKCIFICKT